VSDHTKNALRKSTVGGSSPDTLSVGIKRTAGSHPKERVSGELPRALVHISKIECSLAATVCQALGLACGIRCSGMAPCGPLYPLRSVCHRQGLNGSQLAITLSEINPQSPQLSVQMSALHAHSFRQLPDLSTAKRELLGKIRPFEMLPGFPKRQ